MRRPASPSKLRELVSAKGRLLRSLSFEETQQLAETPEEELAIGSRHATLYTIVEPGPDGSLRVVLQGFMKLRFFPFGSHVAVDGYYKHPDGAVAPMKDRELYEFS